jgi:hypothetical protein
LTTAADAAPSGSGLWRLDHRRLSELTGNGFFFVWPECGQHADVAFTISMLAAATILAGPEAEARPLKDQFTPTCPLPNRTFLLGTD